jgi:O-antigen/teichoic acid export membrane protein
MLTSVVGSGLGFFFWLIIGNTRAPADVGAALILFNTLGFLSALGNLGLGVALVRYLPGSEDKRSLINTSMTVTGAASFGLSAVFLIGLPLWLPSLAFVLQDPLYILTILVCSIALGLAPVLDAAAIAIRRADVQTWRITAFALLKIPFAIGIIVFLPGRAGVFLSLALAFGLSVVLIGFFLLPRALPGYRPRPELRLDPIRPMFRFSIGNYVAGSIGAAGSLLPTSLIANALGPSAGPASAAYFYVALIVANLLYIIPGATFTSFYAEASQKNADRRRDERKAILLSVALLLPAIAVMWVFSETMLRWFGDPAYARQAVTPLRILTFASIPAFLNGILSTRIRIRERTLPLIVAATISTVITLGLGWILLQNPKLGIEGLAYAFVLGQAAATPYFYFEAREAFAAIPTQPVFGPPLE